MFLDDYSLDTLLGKGAFGEVFLTTKKGTNQLFATKKIERELVEKDNIKKYLLNELQILRELNHPNIVKFIEIKKTKNHFYIIMEYCNGDDLEKTLEKYMAKHGKPFSQEIVQYLMRQIMNAFKYIHGKLIIHRDIKLENILLNYDSEEDKKNLNIMKATVKIIDFGFACKIEINGLKYTTLGSPINMDPSILNAFQKRGKKTRKLGYDQKADIWSLGTICYQMVIGKCVFNAQDLDELVQKVENGTYSVPTKLSKELISFLNGMLQYDSSMRLNAEELCNHRFLTKNVKDFQSIDMKKVSKNLDKSRLNINIKQNKSIWAIFNKDDEDKLMKISPQDFDKPIGEESNSNNKILNNNLNKMNSNNINNNKNDGKNNNDLNQKVNNNQNINRMNNNINNNINKNQINKNNNNFNNNINNNLNNGRNNLVNNNFNNNQNNNNNLNQNRNNNINMNDRNSMKINNNLNQNRNNNMNMNDRNSMKTNINRNLNLNNNTYINNRQLIGNQIQNPNQMNQFQRINSNNLPIGNYPFGAMGQQYGVAGYQGAQRMPMQPMVGAPMTAYPQMQRIQGYGMPVGYQNNIGYYK